MFVVDFLGITSVTMAESKSVLWVTVSLCFSFVYSASQTGCTINVLNHANEKYMPVLLHNRSSEYTLIVPDQGEIHVKKGQGITLVCPEKNYLVPTHSNFTYATCVEGTTFKIFRNNYEFDEILCSKPIRGEIQKTKEKCGNRNGQIIRIGYRITSRSFKQLIEICYDEKIGNTLYSQHVIHGEEVKYTSKFKDRPSFSTEGLGKGISANVAYKRAYQKSTFSSLLGSSREAERYINGRSYLSRGHLSPDADFLFASSQLTSYFYINTCPQWQSVNGGNWVRVETAVRKAADKYQRTFLITTGTHEVLELLDTNDNPTQIYLVSKQKLPVPKFVWKIMFDPESGKGIAFVSLNNPFVYEIGEEDLLCNDICDSYGWGSPVFRDLAKGFIYCCDVNELRESVSTIPYFEVNGILSA